MNKIRTILTGLVTGAVASAATTMIMSRVTATASPRCAATGTALPAADCAAMTRLVAADGEHRAALAEARRKLALLEETVRLTSEIRFVCVGPGGPRAGECFRTVDACVTARTSEQACRPQDEALCFTGPDGGVRCGGSLDVCVAMAITAGLGSEARGACSRTYLEPAPPAGEALARPAPPPAPPPS